MGEGELAPLKALLHAHGLWARKGLGQHFLLDPAITARIAALAGPLKGQAVIEVGPGPGGLTRALLAAGAGPVIAIEKDARFLPLLEPLTAWSGGRLRVVCADALTVKEAALLEEAGARAALIVANLPYNVATPLLVKWLKAGPWRGRMCLMFQKEVAERIVAVAGDKAYGRLALLTQAVCAVELVLTLPPGAFVPAPKVASAVVRFTPHAAPFPHLEALERVTAAAFGQRRKMVRSSLSGLPGHGALLAQAGIAPTARAEEIPLAGFLNLAQALAAQPS